MIGNPVAHSRSPAIHAMFADQTGQRMTYGRLLAPLDGFAASVDAFRAHGGRGLNVTVPFKVDAAAYAGRLSARAAVANAVNTLVFDGESVFGDNTDGAGLVADLQGRLGFSLAGMSVLLLGAGGAARGVVQPLLTAGVAGVVVANRTAARAVELVEGMAARLDQVAARAQGYGASRSPGQAAQGQGQAAQGQAPDTVAGAIGSRLSCCSVDALDGRFDLVINATSSGLAGGSPAIAPQVFDGAALAYDLVYASAPTAFMRNALAAGCGRASDGLGMLVEQAAESFALWRGVRPQTRPVFDTLRAELDG